MPDKFTATWVSHSSISDFLRCPRAYYLRNVYKDPETGHKVQLMTPALALGSSVHEVIESLSVLPLEKRFKNSLVEKFNEVWKKVTGEKGGFLSESQEEKLKKLGVEMLNGVMNDPGPLKNRAVKIKAELPYYWLSETDEIILCGKVDWLEYLEETDSVHIIDFKTGKAKEDPSSLQLPIYHLLVHNTQSRDVSKASYWYLRKDVGPEEKELPDLDQAHTQVLEIAKKIKLQRKLGVMKCPLGEGGCFACKPMERIISGEAKMVGVNSYGQDIYILTDNADEIEKLESEIL